MKKNLIFSLIFILNVHNYCIANDNNNNKKFIFQDDNMLIRGLNYVISLHDIKVCDSKSHSEIKANSIANGLYCGYLAIEDITKINENLKKAQQPDDSFGQIGHVILGLFNIKLFVDHIKFCYQNVQTFRKSKKIAHFNKKIKLNMSTVKLKQLIWLTVNTMFPYLTFAAKRMYYDNIDLKNAFYKDNSIDSAAFIYTAYLLANLSENARRGALYKAVKKETLRRLKQDY